MISMTMEKDLHHDEDSQQGADPTNTSLSKNNACLWYWYLTHSKSFMSKNFKITITRPTLQCFTGLPDDLTNSSVDIVDAFNLQHVIFWEDNSIHVSRVQWYTKTLRGYLSVLNKLKVVANNHDMYDGNKLHSSHHVWRVPVNNTWRDTSNKTWTTST